MNILFITKELPYPPNNGCRNRTFNIIKALSKNNRISLLCHGEPEKDAERVSGMRGLCESVDLVPENRGDHKWLIYIEAFLSLFSIRPFGIRIRYSQSMKNKAHEIVDQDHIDLIFCDSIYQASNMPERRCFRILSEHNIESTIIHRYIKVEKNIFKKVYAFLEWLKMRHYENRMWRLFDRCIVVSEGDKREMSSRVKNVSIEVTPNGVDIDYFSPAKVNVKPFSLVYVGQMNWYPNSDAMIYFLENVYPLIKKDIPQVSLCIVGNNPPEMIRDIAKENKSITITGLVDDTRPYIAESELFIVPLRIGGGTRLKILEAMAMGKTIVSTSIGCEGITISDGENIFIADSPAHFAKTVIELFKKPNLRDKVKASARRLVEENYSWRKVTENMQGITI